MTTQIENVSVFHPSGEIDRHDGHALVKKVRESLRTERTKIVLDLSEVEHMHYLVACDLLKLAMLARFGAGEIKIVNAQPATQAILEFVGAGQCLETYDSVAEAVLSFEELSAGSQVWH